MINPSETTCENDCCPHDSVDALLGSWVDSRPDLDFSPVAVISRLARVRAHIGSELEIVFHEFGLGQPDFEALVTLARLGGDHGVPQRQLADALGLTPGTISVRIDRLVDHGLVTRSPDPRSKRNTLVALTRTGRDLFGRVVPAHLANERRLLAALSDQDRELLAALLRKLLVEFEGSQPDSPAPDRLGLVLAPAHVAIGMRAAVGLPRDTGLLVRSIAPDSPAATADLQPGDVLTHAGARELRSSAALHAAIHDAQHGRLQLTVLRGDKRLHTELEIRPSDPSTTRAVYSSPPKRPAEHIF